MTSKKGKIAIPTDAEVAQYAPRDSGDAASASPAGAQEPTPPQTTPAAAGANETVESLRAELESLKDKLLRAQAECANIAKRLTQEHAESFKYAGMDLARALLPVMDNLERTVASLRERHPGESAVEGVALVAEQLGKVLRDHGVAPIEAAGKPFDPSCHQALVQDRESTAPAGTVTIEMQRGYMMRDRLLRPAKVAVAVGETGASQSEAEPPGAPDSSAAANDGAKKEQ